MTATRTKGQTPPTVAGTRGDLAEPGSQLHAEIQTNDAVNNVLYEWNALRQSGLAPWDAPVAGPGRGRTAPEDHDAADNGGRFFPPGAGA